MAGKNIKPVIDAINSITETQAKFQNKLSEIESTSKSARNSSVLNAPQVRKGENSMSSRGYSFVKLFGLLRGELSPENARVEWETAQALQKLYVDRLGYNKAHTNTIMAPFGSDYIAEIPGEEGFAKDIRDIVTAGITGYDREEVRNIRAKQWGVQKAMSWIDESQGGALVAPPIQGELIELLRNNEVFMSAGARTIAMPPNGRITFPRQTNAGTAYWVGESNAVQDSTPATGDVLLQAKKLGILCKVPNELFRFSSVSVEMFLREDISRVLALRLDKSLLEATGSSNEPKGLINYANISRHTAKVTGTNGDTIQPEDIANMIAKVEEQNAQFKSFLMRPLLYAAIANRRSDAVVANDAKGPFVFNMFRELNTNMDYSRTTPGNLYGNPVYKSTQISGSRTKGSSSNLSYILGGDFSDYMIALSGAIEFQISTQGDTPFTTDQTWYRGIMYCDGAPRHEASFVICDNLNIA
jgi:HK97 family phage major capsid protein